MSAKHLLWLYAMGPCAHCASTSDPGGPVSRLALTSRADAGRDELCRTLVDDDQASPSVGAEAIPSLREGCERGQPLCCYNLAWAIENGAGVPRDAQQSLGLFERACNLEVPEACDWLVLRAVAVHDDEGAARYARRICTPTQRLGCNHLGNAMLDGRGMAVDVSGSAQMFALGCDGGDSAACLNYAGSLVHGRGISVDYAQALSIYRGLCDDDDDGQACEDEGELIRDGQGTPADPNAGAELFLQACAMNNANGCAQLGSSFSNDALPLKSPQVAATAFRRACELGQLHSCNIAGLMAINGQGGPPEPAVGVALLESGCAGHACANEQAAGCSQGRRNSACHDLGWALVRGPGVSHDPRRAFFIFAKLCAEGMAEGCEQVGVLEQEGEGVAKDPRKAAALFDQACRQGDLNACNTLGVCYEEGKGVAKDPAQAAQIYQLLCSRDFQLGCSNLGELLRDGRGVRRNLEHARELFDAACQHGEGYGCFNLGKLEEKGQGVARNAARGQALRAQACKLGVPEACAPSH